PEPMFDLGALERTPSRSETVRDRLEDERRLFRMVVGRARRGVVLVASDAHPDAEELTQRTRFAQELGATWHAAPESPFDRPVSTREAGALWRRQLADPPPTGGGGSPRSTGSAPWTHGRRPGGSNATGPTRVARSTNRSGSATR